MKKAFFIVLMLVISLYLKCLMGTVYATQSASTTTRVGNPPENQLVTGSTFADQLVNDITNTCSSSGNFIDIVVGNLFCINNLASRFASPVINALTGSTRSYGVLQCVGFVQAVVTGITGSPLNNGGNAIQYAYSVPTGYQFIHNGSDSMNVGDMPIWDFDTHGHIAYTVEVYGSEGFKVAEANMDNNGLVDERRFPVNDPNLVGWLRKL